MNSNGFPSIFSKGHDRILTRGLLLLTAMIILFTAGCATVGQDFPAYRVKDIQIHKTTKDEIRSMFGPPWRVGIEDGQPTWTYGKYRYQAFSETSTKDLVIRFDNNGIVTSYTFNTTEHLE